MSDNDYTEADYMDDCQMLNLADEHGMTPRMKAYEVVRGQRVVFVGTRAECWAERRLRGGFVQEHYDD